MGLFRLDGVLADRKMSLTELSEKVGNHHGTSFKPKDRKNQCCQVGNHGSHLQASIIPTRQSVRVCRRLAGFSLCFFYRNAKLPENLLVLFIQLTPIRSIILPECYFLDIHNCKKCLAQAVIGIF